MALGSGKVTLDGLTIAAGASVDLPFSVARLAPEEEGRLDRQRRHHRRRRPGPGATGSPTSTTIAPPYAVDRRPANKPRARGSGAPQLPRDVTNLGYTTDSYNLSITGTWPASLYQGDCTTPLTTTGHATGGERGHLRQGRGAGGAANGATDAATLTATSAGAPSLRVGDITTIAVTVDTLVVDNDNNDPRLQVLLHGCPDGQQRRLRACGTSRTNPQLPLGLLTAHTNVVWFTGNSYPAPLGPYEHQLKAFLDSGGRLFMSGQDLLDQAAARRPSSRTTCTSAGTARRRRTTRPTNAVTASPGTR